MTREENILALEAFRLGERLGHKRSDAKREAVKLYANRYERDAYIVGNMNGYENRLRVERAARSRDD